MNSDSKYLRKSPHKCVSSTGGRNTPVVCLLPSPAVHPYPNSAVKRELGVFLTADTTPVTHKDTIIFAIKFWFIHLSFSQNGSLESCVRVWTDTFIPHQSCGTDRCPELCLALLTANEPGYLCSEYFQALKFQGNCNNKIKRKNCVSLIFPEKL